MKIVYDPIRTEGNKYAQIITDGLKSRSVEILSIKDIFSSFMLFREVKIIHLNWFENLDGSSNRQKLMAFCKKFLKLILFKLFNKKIVWTMHNKATHDKELGFFKDLLIKMILSFSSIIIIHSRISLDLLLKNNTKLKAKIKYIPHPNYIGEYGSISLDENKANSNEPIKLLFLGAVKPYKNIELLIDVFRSFDGDFSLVIAGKPMNENYKKYLSEYSIGIKNLYLNLEFINDLEISEYINDCDVLILPYDLRSSLNSGTVILAFSYARTVICPAIGTVMDVTNQDDIFSYSYENQDEHILAIRDRLSDLILKKRDNKDVFRDLGNKMFDYVAKHNDKQMVTENLLSIYYDLI